MDVTDVSNESRSMFYTKSIDTLHQPDSFINLWIVKKKMKVFIMGKNSTERKMYISETSIDLPEESIKEIVSCILPKEKYHGFMHSTRATLRKTMKLCLYKSQSSCIIILCELY